GDFVEEVLRIESPVKGDFRLARRTTTVGGVDIPAGETVMVLNGSHNPHPPPAPLRPPRRPRRRAGERPRAAGLRARRPQLSRRAAGPPGGTGERRALPRPHQRHPHLGGPPRPARCPPVLLRPHLHPAGDDGATSGAQLKSGMTSRAKRSIWSRPAPGPPHTR